MKIYMGLVLIASLLAGCAATPLPPENLPATPVAFKEGKPRSAASVVAPLPTGQAWWTVFGDTTLDDLQGRAAARNTTIQIAAARLSQARAAAKAAGANRLPQFGINAGLTRQGGPLINAAGADGTLVSAAATLSYEADLMGRLSGAADAATLDARASEDLLRAAKLLIQADLAQTYFSLRLLDRERALLSASARTQRESLALMERRLRAGLASELDATRARAEVHAADAEIAAVDRRRADLEHALALLCGESASNFDIASGEWAAPLPNIPPGIPSAVLARRPDVSAAQRSMLAAQKRLGVAHTSWFPSLNLTASGGYASPELSDLFKMSARAWALGAIMAIPLFDGGRREAGIQSASADLDLALARYREQILVAFRDVEDQLGALRHLAEQSAALNQSVAAASRAAKFAESNLRQGLSSQLELLDARRVELRSRRAELAVQSQRYEATVRLVRALGGGWDAAASAQRDASDDGVRVAAQ